MANITKLTEKYIAEHPSIKDALKKGMINYSKLTRQIAKDLEIDLKKNFDAILIACRRYYRKVKDEAVLEKKIIGILKESKVQVKNKIIAVVLEKNIYMDDLLNMEKDAKKKQEDFRMIEGANAITIITTEEFLDRIQKSFKNKILRENKQLAEITIKSPQEIESTSGVISYLYSLFGEHGINITETMSCWTDTIFVIKEEDVGKAMSILRF